MALASDRARRALPVELDQEEVPVGGRLERCGLRTRGKIGQWQADREAIAGVVRPEVVALAARLPADPLGRLIGQVWRSGRTHVHSRGVCEAGCLDLDARRGGLDPQGKRQYTVEAALDDAPTDRYERRERQDDEPDPLIPHRTSLGDRSPGRAAGSRAPWPPWRTSPST